MDQVIVVNGVNKRFRRHDANRPRTFQEAVLRGLRRSTHVEYRYALHDLSFTVAAGEMLGIIGHNGAGKSTLLRLIGGVGRPDSGQITVKGRIGALLDLGAGFHPDLTGRENIYISGVISGLTRREVTQRFDAIVDFAELADYIDSPLRTYSTGMQMRLAFAVAVHIEADILLIDEVLAVGDAGFQRKCLERIARITQEGATGVLVSHDLHTVSQLCDRVLWLDRGRSVAFGAAEPTVEQYQNRSMAETQRLTPTTHPEQRTGNGTILQAHQNRFGSFELEIKDVAIHSPQRRKPQDIDSGDALQINLSYVASMPIDSPIFDVAIVNQDGIVCFKNNTSGVETVRSTVHGAGSVTLEIDRLDLAAGTYYVDVGVYEANWTYAYDYHWHAYGFVVGPGASSADTGILAPPSRWHSQDPMAMAETLGPARQAQTPCEQVNRDIL